jgi:hypothetical protein
MLGASSPSRSALQPRERQQTEGCRQSPTNEIDHDDEWLSVPDDEEADCDDEEPQKHTQLHPEGVPPEGAPRAQRRRARTLMWRRRIVRPER